MIKEFQPERRKNTLIAIYPMGDRKKALNSFKAIMVIFLKAGPRLGLIL